MTSCGGFRVHHHHILASDQVPPVAEAYAREVELAWHSGSWAARAHADFLVWIFLGIA